MPTLAIIAPSAYAPKPEQVERAISRLQQRGWTVKNLVNIESRYQRFSSDEATRLAQLYQAIDDPEVDVVMALRGGYGLSRLLDQIDFARLAASAKLLVGFSDFTALQLGLLAQTGAISFAGPMIYDDLGSEVLQDFTFEHLERCLFYPQVAFTSQASGNPNCEIEGVFWGGNLAMLVHLIASGEASGKLDVMLERAAEQQEQEVGNYTAILTSLLEPVLILVMGGVVLLIVLAILMPIINMNQMVK